MDFAIFISFFIAQRISELFLAKNNERWLRANGAIEYGQRHYPYIVILHVLFIASMIAEYLFSSDTHFSLVFLLLYILLFSSKIWVIASLGTFWNTKIFRLPGTLPVRKGLYKFFKHPNYLIVIGEFIVVPLVFHLYYTAIIFSVLNFIVLWVRVRAENLVWNS